MPSDVVNLSRYPCLPVSWHFSSCPSACCVCFALFCCCHVKSLNLNPNYTALLFPACELDTDQLLLLRSSPLPGVSCLLIHSPHCLLCSCQNQLGSDLQCTPLCSTKHFCSVQPLLLPFSQLLSPSSIPGAHQQGAVAIRQCFPHTLSGHLSYSVRGAVKDQQEGDGQVVEQQTLQSFWQKRASRHWVLPFASLSCCG